MAAFPAPTRTQPFEPEKRLLGMSRVALRLRQSRDQFRIGTRSRQRFQQGDREIRTAPRAERATDDRRDAWQIATPLKPLPGSLQSLLRVTGSQQHADLQPDDAGIHRCRILLRQSLQYQRTCRRIPRVLFRSREVHVIDRFCLEMFDQCPQSLAALFHSACIAEQPRELSLPVDLGCHGLQCLQRAHQPIGASRVALETGQ